MEIDNSGLFKHLDQRTICYQAKHNVCSMIIYPQALNIINQKKCPNCGASERLTTGECAYCRQY